MESRPVPRHSPSTLAIGVLLIVLGILALFDNIFPSFTAGMWSAALLLGAVVMFGIFLLDRSQWWTLIPSYVLLFVAALIFLTERSILRGDMAGAFVMFSIALPFLYIGVRSPGQWWAFIPAYVMGVIGFIILLSERVLRDEMMASFIMFAIAAPFLLVALRNPRERWGFFIPAYIMGALGVMLGFIVDRGNADRLIPTYIMFVIALPFLFVFLRHPRANWWALIPGGIMASIGLGLMAGVGSLEYIVPVALILGGLFLMGSRFVARPQAAPASGPAAESGPEADGPRS